MKKWRQLWRLCTFNFVRGERKICFCVFGVAFEFFDFFASFFGDAFYNTFVYLCVFEFFFYLLTTYREETNSLRLEIFFGRASNHR